MKAVQNPGSADILKRATDLTRERVKACIKGLQSAGRHIGQKHYQMLLDKLNH